MLIPLAMTLISFGSSSASLFSFFEGVIFESNTPLRDFTCGTNRFENEISGLFVRVQCVDLYVSINQCCNSHDSCYDDQSGKSICDNTFCTCMSNATQGSLCSIDGVAFCTAVRLFGQDAYNNAANDRNQSANQRQQISLSNNQIIEN